LLEHSRSSSFGGRGPPRATAFPRRLVCSCRLVSCFVGSFLAFPGGWGVRSFISFSCFNVHEARRMGAGLRAAATQLSPLVLLSCWPNLLSSERSRCTTVRPRGQDILRLGVMHDMGQATRIRLRVCVMVLTQVSPHCVTHQVGCSPFSCLPGFRFGYGVIGSVSASP
jgi:hypothetical protein